MKSKIWRFGIYSIQKIRFWFAKMLIRIWYYSYIDLIKISGCRGGRIPDYLLHSCSRSLKVNNRYHPGEKIIFCVKGKQVKIRVLYSSRRVLNHMSVSGTSGLELTIENETGTMCTQCISPTGLTQMYVSDIIQMDSCEAGRIGITLPPFAVVDSIVVDVNNFTGLIMEKKKKIIVYGSSITHGCAASRSSLSYTSWLEKMTGCDVINFGFSESAKGEKEVIEYIASLECDIMILEFDHNASVEELREAHKMVYETIRKHSDCWIIWMSRFSGGLSITEEEERERICIIKHTYDFALKQRDYKVVFIPGNSVFEKNKSDYFVDGIHPNDKGMKKIAECLYNIIQGKGMLN
ncbi:MAG: SGNH/GDSL hydrolase family protein [Brotaphodocola sp.]